MRTEEEIHLRLNTSNQEYDSIKEWLDKAEKRYRDDKRFFGSADRGEMDYASDELNKVKKEIDILKWVLS